MKAISKNNLTVIFDDDGKIISLGKTIFVAKNNLEYLESAEDDEQNTLTDEIL